MTSLLHEERLGAVHRMVRACGAKRVLDLGCGDGDLFVRLAGELGLVELVGVDLCRASLDRLRARLSMAEVCVPRIDLREASMIDPMPDLAGFDCAILVETIEHIDPDRLSRLEASLFGTLLPRTVVITTPNAEFNPLLGVPAHRMRHPGHRFEWDRAKFRRWCGRAAGLAGYDVRFEDVGGQHPVLGGASQMAVFEARGVALGQEQSVAVQPAGTQAEPARGTVCSAPLPGG
jgi:SAM-dependent methyltransferase